MDKKSRTLLNTAIGFLEGLHFRPEDIMVTGSIALDMQGLKPRNRFIHDVDLIIKMDEPTWRNLKLLEAINLVDEVKDNMYPGRKDTIFFKFKDVTLGRIQPQGLRDRSVCGKCQSYHPGQEGLQPGERCERHQCHHQANP